jgi:hypothetical membrane protein
MAAAAPVLLVGGWTLAAARQPSSYDSRTDTISQLAAVGANDSWIMTLVFATIGVCYLLLALAVREPALPGRIALAIGGAATVLVAVSPEPKGGTSERHGIVATIASSAVAIWPILAARRGRQVAWPLRPAVSATASIVLIGLLVWFVSELHRRTFIGTSERLAATAEALWVGLTVLVIHRSASARKPTFGLLVLVASADSEKGECSGRHGTPPTSGRRGVTPDRCPECGARTRTSASHALHERAAPPRHSGRRSA